MVYLRDKENKAWNLNPWKDYPEQYKEPFVENSDRMNRITNNFMRKEKLGLRVVESLWSLIPRFYPAKPDGPAEEQWKDLWYKQECIVSRTLTDGKKYYHLAYKSENSEKTENGWRRGSWASEYYANVPKYRKELGTLLDWKIAENMQDYGLVDKLKNHTLVICMLPFTNNPAQEVYTYWYTDARKAYDWLDKWGSGHWSRWRTHMWGVPKDILTKEGREPLFTKVEQELEPEPQGLLNYM